MFKSRASYVAMYDFISMYKVAIRSKPFMKAT